MTRRSIVLGARLRCHDAKRVAGREAPRRQIGTPVKVMRIATGEVGGGHRFARALSE